MNTKQPRFTKPTRRTIMVNDSRGCAFRVTRYTEYVGLEEFSPFNAIHQVTYRTDLGGGLSANTLDEIKRLVGAL